MRGAELQGIGKGYWLYMAKHSRSFKIHGGSHLGGTRIYMLINFSKGWKQFRTGGKW